MKSSRCQRRCVLIILAVTLGVPSLRTGAEESATGAWDLNYSIGDRDMSARLSIRKGDAGLVGELRGARGNDTISDLRLADGSLTFTRTVKRGDREMTVRFEGTIKENTLTGAFIFGDRRIKVEGKRARPGQTDRRPGSDRRGQQRRPRERVQPTHANVRYGDHERNVIDFWRAESKSPTPLVVFIHGGGFRGGSKEGINVGMLRELLGASISVAAINYRFVQHAPLPAWHHDSRRALQFMRSRAKEWNIDTSRIGAVGGSAGAQICMWLGFHDEMADSASDDPVTRQSTRLAAVATSGGQTSMDFAWWKKHVPGYTEPHRDPGELFAGDSAEARQRVVEDISALAQISKDDPPIFMSYGMAPDAKIPENPARARGWKVHHVNFGVKLKEKMDTLGIEAHLKYPGSTAKFKSPAEFFIARLGGKKMDVESPGKRVEGF